MQDYSSELVEIKRDIEGKDESWESGEQWKAKNQAHFFSGLGEHGEFKGGLMGDDSMNYSSNPIITSKEDVVNHISKSRSNKHRRSNSSYNVGACKQCILF